VTVNFLIVTLQSNC